MNESMKIFSGSSNKALAGEIADYLKIQLSEVDIIRFKDNEMSVRICENVRGVDVFIIQPTSNPQTIT